MRNLLKEMNLKCGKACIYELCGRDAREMFRIQSQKGGMDEIVTMLIQRSVTIDGNDVDLAQLDDMPFADYTALAGAVMENFTDTGLQAS